MPDHAEEPSRRADAETPNAKPRLKRLCIVSPCYNEEEVIEAFVVRLLEVLRGVPGITWEILLVDDGSTDGTLERVNLLAAKEPTLSAISFSRNFGHQIALSAGLDAARGDAILMMDSDLQHPPDLIPEMVRLWKDENYDIVSAVREASPGASRLKNATSMLFYTMINLISNTRIEPGAADFCLLSRRAHRALSSMPERHRFLRGMVSWIGFRRTYLPFQAHVRAAGRSKYTWAKMIGPW